MTAGDVVTLTACPACGAPAGSWCVRHGRVQPGPLNALNSTHGVLVSTLWDAYQLVHELELSHLLTDVDETEATFMFRVDGDGEELEGIVTERFYLSPADINGFMVPLVDSDLPAVLVDCGDRGSWLVPLSWEVKS